MNLPIYQENARPRSSRTPTPRGPGGCVAPSVGVPGLRDEQLLEQADGIAVGHAGDEVARGGVEALGVDGASVEKLIGPFTNLLPQAAEDVGGFPELGSRDRVFVDRVEQIAAQGENRAE